jgi:tetratricopeptide (TPR) repeat protein
MQVTKFLANSRVKRLIALFILGGFPILFLSCNRDEPPPAASASTPGASVSGTPLIAQADQEYAQRQDLTHARKAVALLRQARTADYGNYEIAWKLARANYYVGAHTDDDTEREGAFREGIEAAKMAVQLQENKPEGHFWLGANYGGDAEHSTLAGLANVEDIRSEMERVLQIDEGYQAGSAYLGLGQLYLQAPRVLGGDTQKAIDYLEKGLKVGSDNALLRVNLAKAYHQAKRDADARKQIDFLLKMNPDADHRAEYDEAVRDAKKLEENLAR